jgi:hypothetical protein
MQSMCNIAHFWPLRQAAGLVFRRSCRVGARPIALTRTSRKSNELRPRRAVAGELDVAQRAKEPTGGIGAHLVFSMQQESLASRNWPRQLLRERCSFTTELTAKTPQAATWLCKMGRDHVWRNRGTKPAAMLFFLNGAKT